MLGKDICSEIMYPCIICNSSFWKGDFPVNQLHAQAPHPRPLAYIRATHSRPSGFHLSHRPIAILRALHSTAKPVLWPYNPMITSCNFLWSLGLCLPILSQLGLRPYCSILTCPIITSPIALLFYYHQSYRSIVLL